MSRKLIALLSALSLIFSFSVLPVAADHTSSKDQNPEVVRGNPSCATVYGAGAFAFEVKIEPVDDSPAGGDPYSSPDGTISGTIILEVDEGAKTFDYTVTGNGAVVGVIVKGGPDGNWYDYIGVSEPVLNIGPQIEDDDLHAPSRNGGLFGLSHISFCMVQAKADPTITTQVKNTNGTADTGDDTNVPNNGNVAIGTTVYDTATLSGATATAGGDANYYVEKGDATCSITGATHLGEVTVVNGVVPASNTFTFSETGTYYFWVVYDGDPNNNGATSACDSEIVLVDEAPTSITTSPWIYPNDSATISASSGGDVAGSVVFRLYDTLANCETNDGSTGLLFEETEALSGTLMSETVHTSNTTVQVTADAVVWWHVSFTSTNPNQGSRVSDCVENIDVDLTGDATGGTAP